MIIRLMNFKRRTSFLGISGFCAVSRILGGELISPPECLEVDGGERPKISAIPPPGFELAPIAMDYYKSKQIKQQSTSKQVSEDKRGCNICAQVSK